MGLEARPSLATGGCFEWPRFDFFFLFLFFFAAKPSRKRSGPSGMRRVAGTPFAADYWQAQEGLRMYFLSHMHADHTHGLGDGWALGTIFCSPVTKALLHLKWPGIAEDRVVALEEGATHLLFLDEGRTMSMTVGLVPANHCPGAVMFLWQGYFGTLLYTGDFRFHPAMLEEGPLAGVAVDTLFLDNTYLDSSFDFPSQRDALAMLLAEMGKRPDIRRHTVLVGIDTLGKERLLVDLALHYGTCVEVQPERYRALAAIHALGGLSDAAFGVFYDAEQLPPRDIAGPLLVLSPKTGLGMALRDRQVLLKEAAPNETPLVMGVLPTGWVHVCEDKNARFADYAPIVRVPYSIHSSYREILELVRCVRPVRVVPIVPNSPCPFSVLAPLLASERHLPPVVVPPCLLPTVQKVEPLLAAARLVDKAGKGEAARESKPAAVAIPPPAGSRKRIGVSDEKMEQIAGAIERNSKRLGLAPRTKREPPPLPPPTVKAEAIELLDDNDKEEDGENAPGSAQLLAMFERSQRASQERAN